MSATDVFVTDAQHEARWKLWKAEGRALERRRVGRVRILAGVVALAMGLLWLTLAL